MWGKKKIAAVQNEARIIADPTRHPLTYIMPNRRTVFFISDRTGITVEMLGNSLLTQFDSVEFKRVTLPFIDNLDKVRNTLGMIDAASRESGKRSLVFTSLMSNDLRHEIATANAMVLDLFDRCIVPP